MTVSYTHLDLAPDGFVIVDHIRHGVDQLDGEFGPLITGGGLCAKDKGPGYHIHLRVIL